ncbi:MAG: HlyD family type I secretion periplasmic adaptor subunit [Hyphomicrobium sp.]
MTASAEERAQKFVQRNVSLGLGVLVLLAGSVGGWAGFADVSGAVIAPGVLVVESNVKKIQHPTGGVVGELRVREGDRVQVGDVLIKLDETTTRAELAIASKAFDDMTARRARLEAERDGLASVAFPAELTERKGETEVAHRIESETRAFEQGRAAREGQKAQLRERISQLRESIAGYEVRQKAKLKELELINTELTGSRDLWKRGLYPITKLTALEREAASTDGERGQLLSVISEQKGKIAETELQILQVDRDLSSEVGKALRETESKIDELIERKIAAEDKLKRVEIRAPQAGHVHELKVYTVGGVITAGEPIMLIVPDGDDLTVEAKIAPADIDQVQQGQTAMLRFSAFNMRTTPEVHGKVDRVSADIEADDHTGRSFYVARISVLDQQPSRLSQLKLVPGMPVEVFIKTQSRRVMSYLTKPFTDQMQRAFREE